MDCGATNQNEDVVVYLSAGHLPFSWEKDLGQTMKDYLCKQLVTQRRYEKSLLSHERDIVFNGKHRIEIVNTEQVGYGTIEETFAVAKQLGFETEITITVFSSPGHLERIAHIWSLFAPKWNVIPKATNEEMSEKLVSLEVKKNKLVNIFFWTYSHLGETAFQTLSFIKNLFLNRIFKVQE